LTAKRIDASDGPVETGEPYIWDEKKRAANLREHRIDFNEVYRFDWQTAVVFVDDREDYGELREVAIGFIDPGLYVLTFTRRGEQTRIISLRKAEKSDVRKYAEATR
jgi:uncharacterized DUF497 family protein